ncbi:aquaporin 9 [Trichuris trichiura]|uniref:Aquaporin 9 n=1 Tax=Trichuris trichiura TaxID=36087 RepID=A0A077ZAQ0_TRITR|nr:aquaporin 9 [Trichuris trichiura]
MRRRKSSFEKRAKGTKTTSKNEWTLFVRSIRADISVGNLLGGHINPAVTLALCIVGNCQWKLLPAYWIGQYFGAFIASSILYGVYSGALNKFDQGNRMVSGPTATASIFATYPLDHVSNGQTFFDQIVSTGILLLIVCAITDERNMEVPKHIVPLAIGTVFVAILSAFGFNCGGAMNPARDFSPRVFTAVAGWGSETFSYRNYWFWVPIIGPYLGAIVGAALYQLLIAIHWPMSHQVSGLGTQKESLTLQ